MAFCCRPPAKKDNYSLPPETQTGAGTFGCKINGGAGYNKGSEKFTTGKDVTGEFLFKRFDEVNRIASGTFWFDAIDANGEVIHVTEGRFDVKFTR